MCSNLLPLFHFFSPSLFSIHQTLPELCILLLSDPAWWSNAVPWPSGGHYHTKRRDLASFVSGIARCYYYCFLGISFFVYTHGFISQIAYFNDFADLFNFTYFFCTCWDPASSSCEDPRLFLEGSSC